MHHIDSFSSSDKRAHGERRAALAAAVFDIFGWLGSGGWLMLDLADQPPTIASLPAYTYIYIIIRGRHDDGYRAFTGSSGMRAQIAWV